MNQVLRLRTQKQISRIVKQCCACFSDESGHKKVPLPTSDKSDTTELKVSTKTYNPNEPKPEELVWRTPKLQNDKYYRSFLRTFYKEESNVSYLKWIQQPVSISPKIMKNWWMEKNDAFENAMQQFSPERHQILGPDLACAHFIVARGGAVKFHDENKWIKAKDGDYQLLPNVYKRGCFLEAIDCSNMVLKYEGLANMRDLSHVEWLSLRGCKHIDDFCMDTVSHIFAHSLKYLDLRNCFNISEKGLGALYKMHHLQTLYIDDLLKDTKYELTCLLLEELNPELKVISDVVTFEVK